MRKGYARGMAPPGRMSRFCAETRLIIQLCAPARARTSRQQQDVATAGTCMRFSCWRCRKMRSSRSVRWRGNRRRNDRMKGALKLLVGVFVQAADRCRVATPDEQVMNLRSTGESGRALTIHAWPAQATICDATCNKLRVWCPGTARAQRAIRRLSTLKPKT